MTVGERIKDLRLKSGISQVNFADKINVSKQTLYKYENNIITNIPSDKIELMAKVLHTTPAYLMGWELNAEDIGNVFYSHMTRGVINQMRAVFSEHAVSHFETYGELNHQNKKLVDSYTEKLLSIQQMDDNLYELNAAHEDETSTPEERKAGDDLMMDDSEWE